MRKLISFLVVLAFFPLASRCARKKMSSRDSKREQVRNTADAKRQELFLAAGVYRGFLTHAGHQQDITLKLEIKDIPDTSGGDVDPVLVPILTGFLRLTFGTTDSGEFYSYGIQKADFDNARKKVDLVVNNEQLKQIVLSLEHRGDSLSGSWNSPSLSTSGEVMLQKAADPLHLKASNAEMKGEYAGMLTWAVTTLYQLGRLTLSTSQDKPDYFAMSGNIKLISGDASSSESLVYSFDQIEFNPLTTQISIKGTNAEVYFVGTFENGSLLGSWYSKFHGKIGSATFQKNATPSIPRDLVLMEAIKGTYYGTFVNTNAASKLPSRIMLSLVSIHDPEKPGGLMVSGKVRYYYGSFTSAEFIELPFDHIEYNFFTRNLDAKTSGSAVHSFEAKIEQGVVSGTVSDGALGEIGSFKVGRTLPIEENASMGGDHQGYVTWNGLHAYQPIVVNIQPTFTHESGLRLSATAKLSFGGSDGEQLVYTLDETEFTPTSGLTVFKAANADIMLKGYLSHGDFIGEWFTSIRGLMGQIHLSKNSRPLAPESFLPMPALKGTYQGALQNTSSQTNLPERLMLGLVSSPDHGSPRGIKISGNMRFYLGGFSSDEYIEATCTGVHYDFFTRVLTMPCAAAQIGGITLKGEVGAASISAHLFHDSLGEIGKSEVFLQ